MSQDILTAPHQTQLNIQLSRKENLTVWTTNLAILSYPVSTYFGTHLINQFLYSLFIRNQSIFFLYSTYTRHTPIFILSSCSLIIHALHVTFFRDVPTETPPLLHKSQVTSNTSFFIQLAYQRQMMSWPAVYEYSSFLNFLLPLAQFIYFALNLSFIFIWNILNMFSSPW
jgi:hypothetical protein